MISTEAIDKSSNNKLAIASHKQSVHKDCHRQSQEVTAFFSEESSLEQSTQSAHKDCQVAPVDLAERGKKD